MNQACKQFLTLAFALVFTAGMAMAQSDHDADIDQGTDDVVYLDQIAIQQFGSSADIDQAGDGNLIEGLNNKDFTSRASVLYVSQSGGSTLKGEQVGNGGGNIIKLNQTDGAYAEIYQQQNVFGQAGTNNVVDGLQGRATSVGSDLYVFQQGPGNKLLFEQTRMNSVLDVTQIGEDGVIEVQQR
jgi:hypothetical protein